MEKKKKKLIFILSHLITPRKLELHLNWVQLIFIMVILNYCITHEGKFINDKFRNCND